MCFVRTSKIFEILFIFVKTNIKIKSFFTQKANPIISQIRQHRSDKCASVFEYIYQKIHSHTLHILQQVLWIDKFLSSNIFHSCSWLSHTINCRLYNLLRLYISVCVSDEFFLANYRNLYIQTRYWYSLKDHIDTML